MVIIRPFRSDDADAVQRLFLEGQRDFMEGHFPAETAQQALDDYIHSALTGDLADITATYLERSGSNFWIAEQDGQPIGCLGVYRRSDAEAEIRRVAVDRNARRSGVASRLMDQAEAFCRAAGYARIILWTASFLTAAIDMYQRRGYRRVAEEGFPNTSIAIYQYTLDL